ncbi:MAG: glycosyltransferase [Methanosphaera sp.]|nr:glycosyltransferase [Methanosphaera sp.]
MVKVSIVIPVYNVENYLRECLDSVVNQTLTDIEIICINDGSPDNSLEILEEYAKRDDRITVIDQENGGHAVATNRGIELAKGEYLYLMDSDDIVELNTLELTYNRAQEKNVDFVMFKAINYDYPTDTYYETEVYSMNKIYEKVGDDVFDYHDIGNLMFEASVTPWSKLYRRDFVMKNNIRFPEGLIFEDNVFFYKALLSAKRICFIDEFLFIRRWYSNSSTTAGDLRFLNSLDVYNLMFDVFKQYDEYDNYKNILLNRKISTAIMRYNKIKPEFKDTFFNEMKKNFIETIFNDPIAYRDFMKLADYRYKKMFEQVLISDNCYEFDSLRKIYDTAMSNADYKKRELKRIVNHEFENLGKIDKKYKQSYYSSMKQAFTDILMDSETYFDFMTHQTYKNRKRIERMIIADNYDQWLLLNKIYDEKMFVDNSPKMLENTDDKLEEAKKTNDELLNSNSWKLVSAIKKITG